MAKIEKCYGILPLKKEGAHLKVLLALHVKGSYWAFPKGHLDQNEDPKEGAKRELFEETNLRVQTFLNKPSLKEDYQFQRNGQDIHKYVEYFPAYVEGELNIKEPDEIQELGWFEIEEAIEKISFEQSQTLLKKFISLL